MGVQFENVGESTGIPIKKLVTVGNPLGGTQAAAAADQIWTYDGHTWTKYYYYKRGATTKWCKAGTTVEIGDDVVLQPGQSFFFVRSTADSNATTTLTLAGGVVTLSSKPSYSVAAGSTTAMAWPWPEAMKIKDFNNYNPNPLGGTQAAAAADQIWTYDGHTWTKYYFYKRGATAKWCKAGSTVEIGDDVVVEAGSAFFFVRSTAATGATTIEFAR